MLTQLIIHNFAITDHLDLELNAGLSVLTGETGAGKSITLDALNQVIGARADSKLIRQGCDKADIHAVFDISQLNDAQQWMQTRELNNTDQECILRRSISKDGRSRAYINGHPCTLSDLQSLSSLLISVHGQHAQQQLLNPQQQCGLLDRYAGAHTLVTQIKSLTQRWQQLQKTIDSLQNDDQSIANQRDLLIYQLEELDTLALQENELTSLEQQQKELSQAEEILLGAQTVLTMCNSDSDEVDIRQLLNRCIQTLSPYRSQHTLKECCELLTQTVIQIEEVDHLLKDFQYQFHANPEQLQQTEQRLDKIYQLSRKHRIAPDMLSDHSDLLSASLQALEDRDTQVAALEEQAHQCLLDYKNIASKLSKVRNKAAQQLARSITQQLEKLSMPNAKFSIEFIKQDEDKPRNGGLETPQFLISTNPGQAPGTLKNIASGGELSRISLAIEVATQTSTHIPTLIFDEIDAGVGGATAEVVGKLLQDLGANKQIICVTHQAQLAAKAHHHFNINKVINNKKKQANTSIELLNEEQRIEEISRMIGGLSITSTTRKHAAELLKPN